MLTFDEYCKMRDQLEKEIKEIELKAEYCSIRLLGHRPSISYEISKVFYPSNSSTGNIERDRDKQCLDNNVEYQKLLYKHKELMNKLDFIRTYAELPTINEN